MEKLSVLVVEDVDTDAELLRRALEAAISLQHWECVATPGDLARALNSHYWDAVLCDWSLPGFGGEQVLEQCRAHDAYLPVIIVTGTLDDADAPELYTLGAADYLQKDRLSRLPSAVADVVQRARSRRLVDLQREVLLDIARGEPLTASMGHMMCTLDRLLPGMRSALLCLDEAGRYVTEVIAPGMAAADREALAGAAPGDIRAGWVRRLQGDCGLLLLEPDSPDTPLPPDPVLIDAVSALAELGLQRYRDASMQQLATETLDNMVEGVAVMDPDMRVTWVNKSFTDISGMAPEAVLGQVPPYVNREREAAADIVAVLDREGKWQGELMLTRADGTLFPALVTASAVKDAGGVIRKYVAVFNDISTMRDYERRLDYLVHHDPLTQLPNRGTLQTRLAESIERARHHGHGVALIHLDLDHFRTINDSLGQDAGDKILKSAAARLRDCVRDTDIIGRFGDDEFGIIIDQFHAPEECVKVVEQVLARLGEPYLYDGRELYTPASAGVACYPQDGTSVAVLARNADIAMHRAKEKQRGSFEFFSSDMGEVAYEHLVLINSLRGAVDRGEFVLEYQPKVAFDGNRITSVEALVRWRHPERGVVPPADFIPLAEEAGLIGEIGSWVLSEACRQAAVWRRDFPELRVAVNLSVRQLDTGLVNEVSRCLLAHRLEPAGLELELTESSLMVDPDGSRQVLEALDGIGVAIAIDDFGTGYSSLSYLKRIPARILKIDRVFIHGLPDDDEDVELVRTIIAVARTMKLTITAEGVETQEQRAFLQSAGCDEYQGYLYSHPLPAAQMSELLVERYRGFTMTDRMFGWFQRRAR